MSLDVIGMNIFTFFLALIGLCGSVYTIISLFLWITGPEMDTSLFEAMERVSNLFHKLYHTLPPHQRQSNENHIQSLQKRVDSICSYNASTITDISRPTSTCQLSRTLRRFRKGFISMWLLRQIREVEASLRALQLKPQHSPSLTKFFEECNSSSEDLEAASNASCSSLATTLQDHDGPGVSTKHPTPPPLPYFPPIRKSSWSE